MNLITLLDFQQKRNALRPIFVKKKPKYAAYNMYMQHASNTRRDYNPNNNNNTTTNITKPVFWYFLFYFGIMDFEKKILEFMQTRTG